LNGDSWVAEYRFSSNYLPMIHTAFTDANRRGRAFHLLGIGVKERGQMEQHESSRGQCSSAGSCERVSGNKTGQ
jgi:hypothetical protein